MAKPTESPVLACNHPDDTGADVLPLAPAGDSLHTPPPPDTVSTEAGQWWARITDEYSIDDPAGLLLLQTGLEAFDEMRRAQRAIEKDGATVPDRFGQLKAHPLTTVERDSRAQMLQAMKLLRLDFAPGEN